MIPNIGDGNGIQNAQVRNGLSLTIDKTDSMSINEIACASRDPPRLFGGLEARRLRGQEIKNDVG